MTSIRITPVILAGGKGTRLWPLSRTELPKQFCNLNGEESLFQKTVKRFSDQSLFNAPIVITGSSYLEVVSRQIDELEMKARQIICEPCGRDTAPAIALASIAGKNLGAELMLAVPSDHLMLDETNFADAIRSCSAIALEYGKIVTFGIRPKEAATGFGYLEAGAALADGLGYSLERFVEKPEKDEADQLLKTENVFWNAGIFMFSPKVMCRDLEVHAADIKSKVCKSVYHCDFSEGIIRPDEVSFSEIKPLSIDYAVMEHTTDAAIVPIDPQWSDVGSWNAVWESSPHDQHGNAVSGESLCVDTTNSYIHTDGPFVGVAGLSDVVVVANRDAVLVTSRETCQSVKHLISDMATDHETLTRSHAGETRPWGTFASLNKGDNHQVKTITVKPGGQLSLQYHFHRAEHWIVVAGSPTVTVGDEVMQLSPCQQVFIPQGAIHRLENHTDEDIQIIEVQYGSYLGEDDIVRLSDVYGRPGNDGAIKDSQAA